ncbi:Pcryo [Acrasis kona]
MSTRSFLDSHSIYTKDLALVLCILGSLTLAILNSLVTKRIQYSYFTAKLNKMKLNSLLQSHKKTNVLLQKIGLRESKSRATIDAIPDIIFTIDSNGDIVQTNATFDKVVKLSAQDLEKRVPFKTILCNLDDSFLTKDDSIELVDTVVSIPQDGSTIKVQATVRNLHQREGQEESHVVVCKINEEQEELLRNLSVFEKTSKLRLRFVDLEVTLRDKNYKGQLVAFCASIKDPVKSTRALRLIKFIEAVESYKKHTFDQRIVDQEILYKKFFPLNGAIITDTNLLSLLSVMVTKSKGDMNIYDDVCDVVKLEFLNDYFVSFAPRTNSSNSDSEGFTVDETVLDTNASINTATSDHF